MHPKSARPFSPSSHLHPASAPLFEPDEALQDNSHLHAPLSTAAGATTFLPPRSRRAGRILPPRHHLYIGETLDRERLERDALDAAKADDWSEERITAFAASLKKVGLAEMLRRCCDAFNVWEAPFRFHQYALFLEGVRSVADLFDRMRQVLGAVGCSEASINATLAELDGRCFVRTVRDATAFFSVRYTADELLCGPPPLHRQCYRRWDDGPDDRWAEIAQHEIDLVCYGGDGLLSDRRIAFAGCSSVDDLLRVAQQSGSRYGRRLPPEAEQLRQADFCTAVRWLQLHAGICYRLEDEKPEAAAPGLRPLSLR